jgi:signal peptidase II
LQAAGGAALISHGTDDHETKQPPVEPPPPAGARRAALYAFGLAAVVVVALDLLVKHLTVTQLADREPVRLLGGALYLVHVRNSGAAFSFGQGYTFVFPLVAAIVVTWIGCMARRLASTPWAIALGLVLGGALGNLIDRLFRAPGPFLGHVVDTFSVFDDGGQVFPVFNIADAALTVGVVLAIFLELTGRRRDGTRVTERDRG